MIEPPQPDIQYLDAQLVSGRGGDSRQDVAIQRVDGPSGRIGRGESSQVPAADRVADTGRDAFVQSGFGQFVTPRATNERYRVGHSPDDVGRHLEVTLVAGDDLARRRVEDANPSVDLDRDLPRCLGMQTRFRRLVAVDNFDPAKARHHGEFRLVHDHKRCEYHARDSREQEYRDRPAEKMLHGSRFRNESIWLLPEGIADVGVDPWRARLSGRIAGTI